MSLSFSFFLCVSLLAYSSLYLTISLLLCLTVHRSISAWLPLSLYVCVCVLVCLSENCLITFLVTSDGLSHRRASHACTYWKANRHIDGRMDRYSDRQSDRDSQIERRTDRQTASHIDTQTHKNKHTRRRTQTEKKTDVWLCSQRRRMTGSLGGRSFRRKFSPSLPPPSSPSAHLFPFCRICRVIIARICQ